MMSSQVATLWQCYSSGDRQACLRFAAERTFEDYGIDSLAAAGASLMHLRRIEEGVYMLKAAAAFRPDAPNLYHFACAITAEYVLADQLEYFSELGLRDFPDDLALQRSRAAAKFLKMDYPTAIAYYDRVLCDDPRDIDAHLSLATMYQSMSEFDKAEHHYAKASDLDADNAGVAIGQASIHLTFGRSEEARALLKPHTANPNVRFMIATDDLARGDYRNGWAGYGSRWDTALGRSQTKPPRPFGDLAEIQGKRVAVLREGGHGDVIQFLRYIPMLAAHAAEVVLYVLPSELRLVQHNMPSNVILRATTEAPDDCTYTTAVFDLPSLFQTTLDTIPPAPYLTVPEELLVQRQLLPTAKKRVGLVWAGGAQINTNDRSHDRYRSISLAELASFARFADDVEFINLQAGPRSSEKGLRTAPILDPDFDWLDTAAIVKQLDLVITVDTAMVHLAGALGSPTWLLSRHYPCWRWLGNRPDSPWYPGIVRVFGQTSFNEWGPIISSLSDELARWLSGPEPSVRRVIPASCD